MSVREDDLRQMGEKFASRFVFFLILFLDSGLFIGTHTHTHARIYTQTHTHTYSYY